MKALNLCRDEIPNYNPSLDSVYLSLDFNHSGYSDEHIEQNGHVSGIEIILPDFIQEGSQEYKACANWAELLQKFYEFHGLFVPLRGNNGIKYSSQTGRGTGAVHLEPFFARDKRAVSITRDNAAGYAFVIYLAFSELENAIAILPHKTTDGGAETDCGLNERDFAREFVMPHLL